MNYPLLDAAERDLIERIRAKSQSPNDDLSALIRIVDRLAPGPRPSREVTPQAGTYSVEVVRTASRTKWFNVEADDWQAAEAAALEMAPEEYFDANEKEVDYEVMTVKLDAAAEPKPRGPRMG